MLSVKVNGTMHGLVHKSSMHMAKNTAPDVCKTPSPGGPVPIPYPVIVSFAKNLANGTTTVKADGGQMIAVKDCEYSMCTGDEPGTAGGVVSSTFKKEAKFILYSFDVKMDGKNACRQGDKMTMNHQNTVCMGGTFPTNCKPNEFPLNIDCDKKRKQKKKWDHCMVQELCAKVAAFNRSRKKKVRLNPSPSNAPPGSPARLAYDGSISKFVRSFAQKVTAKKFTQAENMFLHPCRAKKWRDSGRPMPIPRARNNVGVNPDHLVDAGLGGGLGTRNMKWINSRVNGTIGGCMAGFDPNVHSKIVPNPNCGCT
jgi:hypothetical protein